MKINKYSKAPLDAKNRVKIELIACYAIDNLREINLPILHNASWSAPKDLLKDLSYSKLSNYNRSHGID